MKEKIKDYFSFSASELRGILVMAGLIIVAIVFRIMMPLFVLSPQIDFEPFQNQIAEFEKSYAIDSQLVDRTDSSSIKVKEKKYYPRILKSEKPDEIIEINSADSSMLLKIKGIGPVFSARILKYRDLLGGYFSKDQLLEVYGMDSLRWMQVCQQITIDTSLIRKIPVNTATFNELVKHPYLDYNRVITLVKYREKSGAFQSLQPLFDLLDLSADESRKLGPYIGLSAGAPENEAKPATSEDADTIQ